MRSRQDSSGICSIISVCIKKFVLSVYEHLSASLRWVLLVFCNKRRKYILGVNDLIYSLSNHKNLQYFSTFLIVSMIFLCKTRFPNIFLSSCYIHVVNMIRFFILNNTIYLFKQKFRLLEISIIE